MRHPMIVIALMVVVYMVAVWWSHEYIGQTTGTTVGVIGVLAVMAYSINGMSKKSNSTNSA